MPQSAYFLNVMRDNPWLFSTLDDSPTEGVNDRSGNGRSASTGTAFTQGQIPIAPGLGRSTILSGGSPYIQYPAPPASDMQSGGAFTVELWFQPTGNESSSSGLYFWGAYESTQQRTHLDFGVGGGLNVSYANGSGAQSGNGAGSNIVGVAGMTYHIVFTSNGTMMTFWINGAVVTTVAWGTRPANGPTSMRLGRGPDGFWGDVQGYHSNFAYYSGRALPDDRIREHYRVGMGNLRSGRLRRAL